MDRISVDIREELLEADRVLMHAGIVGVDAIEIIEKLVVKLISGKSVTQANNDIMVDLTYRKGVGLDYQSLVTIFHGLGNYVKRKIESNGLTDLGLEHEWRVLHHTPTTIYLGRKR